MKKLHRILFPILLGALCTLWSCTKEHVRNDISLEMTDEDSVEAIVDQDLLTAGGTTVNVEQEPGKLSGKTAEVAYVDQVEMQKPVIVQSDKSLKPGAKPDALAGMSVDESLVPEPVVPTPTGAVLGADVSVTRTTLGPLPGSGTAADKLNKEAAEPAAGPGSIAVRLPGAAAIPAVIRTTALPATYPQHTVKSGDTLWSISKKYGCTISELAAANGLSRKSILHIGQSIVVPTSKTQEAATPAGETPGPSVSLAPSEGKGPGATEGVVPDTGSTSAPPETVASGTGSTAGAPAAEGGSPKPDAGASLKGRNVETETYAVQQGDSFWKIARRHGITVGDLKTINDTTSDKLAIGQKILVPKK